MSTKEDQYQSTYDMKSLIMSFAYTLLFVLPVAWYFAPTKIIIMTSVTVAFLLLSYFVEPVGWKRPHPYSDDLTNRPPVGKKATTTKKAD